MPSVTELKSELERIIETGERACVAGDLKTADAAIEQANRVRSELREAERNDALKNIGRRTFHGPTLADALLDQGFSLKSHPHVTVPQEAALGVQFKAGSVDGGVDGTEIVDEFVARPLGVDTHIHPPAIAEAAGGGRRDRSSLL
jgi:hypothetical protein